jgi:hypothetical protein
MLLVGSFASMSIAYAAQAAAVSEKIEAVAQGAGEWDPTYTVEVHILAPEGKVLFSGDVSLKSPTMMAGEFLAAVSAQKGIVQEGIDAGYVTALGDYSNNTTTETYWLYTVNGLSPAVGCNQYQLRDGDVMVWEYKKWQQGAAPEAVPVLDAKSFEVGSDSVEMAAEGAGEWDPTYAVHLKIVAPDGVELFNGNVSLKSPTMWASEFLNAALAAKNVSQVGLEQGYVTSMGDYENNTTLSMYWMYYVNGLAPAVGCNQYQLRDGDYMLWSYEKYQ